MNRIELLEKALKLSREKYQGNPNYFVLKAIINQLEYLTNIANGREYDLSKLDSIIIGRMTAQDIDNWDPQLAEILHLVSAEAKKMNLEHRKELK